LNEDQNTDDFPGNDYTCLDRQCIKGACFECETYRPNPNQRFRLSLKTAVESMRELGEDSDALSRVEWRPPLARKGEAPPPACKAESIQAEHELLLRHYRRLCRLHTAWKKDAYICRLMPRLYRKTRLESLPHLDAARLALSADLRQGLMLWGPTGTGKSRTAWCVVEQWIRATHSRWECTYLEGSDIADAANRNSRAGTLTDWVNETADTRCLFIDDIGHGNFSNSYAEGLRKLIERCMANEVRMIITSQHDGKGLLKAWSREDPARAETAKAIVRRLGEACRGIKFIAPSQAPDSNPSPK
jgi:DNA replication protein DnaC